MLVKVLQSSNIGKETINEYTRLKDDLGKHGIYTKIFVESRQSSKSLINWDKNARKLSNSLQHVNSSLMHTDTNLISL